MEKLKFANALLITILLALSAVSIDASAARKRRRAKNFGIDTSFTYQYKPLEDQRFLKMAEQTSNWHFRRARDSYLESFHEDLAYDRIDTLRRDQTLNFEVR